MFGAARRAISTSVVLRFAAKPEAAAPSVRDCARASLPAPRPPACAPFAWAVHAL